MVEVESLGRRLMLYMSLYLSPVYIQFTSVHVYTYMYRPLVVFTIFLTCPSLACTIDIIDT